ncbi:sugar phosphate isomerase/epimerase family protein [Tamlana sp. I1]|uniref:sugar phosphate isomerase/epimerase family protein n=1 Tax=Tamlana sp. I1 TaxID=2762061 RepID=UPI00188DD3EC|nr:TIM barrel protein [Tamlana sp. I1]
MKRRNFISKSVGAATALTLLGLSACKDKSNTKSDSQNINHSKTNPLFFKLSLAQWSLHRALFNKEMQHLDFAAKARQFNFEGLEYVNAFFHDKANDKAFLSEMNSRANSEGLQNVLIMIDGEGALADQDNAKRLQAIENHYKWVEAAHYLGCHAIRVNLAGGVHADEAAKASLDSLSKLSDFAAGSNINILVENHGGFSSNGAWMDQVFSKVKNKNCGTLPDFGNFCIEKDNNGHCIEAYDKFQGIKDLLPYAKAISAKSYDFNDEGDETQIDYYKTIKLIKDSGYNGFIGVEYEGKNTSEEKGIILTRDLLIRAGTQVS